MVLPAYTSPGHRLLTYRKHEVGDVMAAAAILEAAQPSRCHAGTGPLLPGRRPKGFLSADGIPFRLDHLAWSHLAVLAGLA
jgi:hypothetical protein